MTDEFNAMDQFDMSDEQTEGASAYSVDIALVIDATGSMHSIIDEVKKEARNFCNKFTDAMEAEGKHIDKLRMKVIAFRDYAYDAEDDAMNESPFFMLPDEEDALSDFVNQIEAKGGGDEPENALEAISLAMRSEWDTESAGKHRHVILLFTDASAVPLEDDSEPVSCKRKRKDNPNYPTGIPANWSEFSEWWMAGDQSVEGMPEQRSKRMILFAPDAEAWQKIASTFDLIWHVISKANQGCEEFDIQEAISVLVGSV